jgi:YHS domain-containing protein
MNTQRIDPVLEKGVYNEAAARTYRGGRQYFERGS